MAHRLRAPAPPLALAATVLALVGAAGARAASLPAAQELEPLSLAEADARCFSIRFPAESAWPVAPTGVPAAVRGSFNEPRGPVHQGVDVEALDEAPVYSIAAGFVTGLRKWKIRVKTGATTLSYWHIAPEPGLAHGDPVARGELLGRARPNYDHVHVSERTAGCGVVDPRRPGGPLHDPLNTAAPRIGELAAYEVRHAFGHPPSVGLEGRDYTDAAEPLPLDALSGVVDLRAEIDVLPDRRLARSVQLPGAPAAIRAWLALLDTPEHAVGPVFRWSGARAIDPRRVWRLWAAGTYRSALCYFPTHDPADVCGFRLVFHVGGPSGFDTNAVPEGRYQFCVEAVSVNDVSARSCTEVAVVG